MKQLEKEIMENDILGFYSLLQLVKTDLRMRQGRNKGAKDLLNSTIVFTNNRST